MAFFTSAISVLQTLVIALGAGRALRAQSTCWKATASAGYLYFAELQTPAYQLFLHFHACGSIISTIYPVIGG